MCRVRETIKKKKKTARSRDDEYYKKKIRPPSQLKTVLRPPESHSAVLCVVNTLCARTHTHTHTNNVRARKLRAP